MMQNEHIHNALETARLMCSEATTNAIEAQLRYREYDTEEAQQHITDAIESLQVAIGALRVASFEIQRDEENG